jgi:hypothetical protein
MEAKDYKGITPLKTTRAEVEQKFGESGKVGNYKIDDEFFTVYYLEKPCNNKVNCDCFVSTDTVI